MTVRSRGATPGLSQAAGDGRYPLKNSGLATLLKLITPFLSNNSPLGGRNAADNATYDLVKLGADNRVKIDSSGRGVDYGATGYEMGMQRIAEVLLGADTVAVNFQNIPATFRHLKLICHAASAIAGQNIRDVYMRVNNDATAGRYNGGGFTSDAAGPMVWISDVGAAQTQFRIGRVVAQAAREAPNNFGMLEIDIFNYASAVAHVFRGVSTLVLGNAATDFQTRMMSGYYIQLAAINRIDLSSESFAAPDSWKAGSRFTLYGLL